MMGSYTFRWEHPADTVYVTGSFDSWSKSVQLEKTGSAFEKTVTLPHSEDQVLYKFVADGVWKHDHTAKTKTDHDGNVNNVIDPEDITPASTSKSDNEDTMAGGKKKKSKQVKAAAVGAPAAGGAAVAAAAAASSGNQKASASNAIDELNTKKDVEGDQTVGVAPIPATGGTSNPVSLPAGEKVPEASSLTGNTINSNVKLDKESYEKSDAGAPVLPPIDSTTKSDATGAGFLAGGLGPQTTNMIPESSMGMGKDTPAAIDPAMINSVGAQSSTNKLAGAVPLEADRVPEVVTDSQKAAHVNPEASGNPEAIHEKDAMEKELQQKVPEAKATSTDSGINGKTVAGLAAGGVAAGGAGAAGAAYAMREKATEATGTDPVSHLPTSVQNTISGMNKESDIHPTGQATGAGDVSTTGAAATGASAARTTSNEVPAVVSESQKAAHVGPEASANETAVHEKDAMESELLKKVPEAQGKGESAPASGTSAAAAIPAAAGVGAVGVVGAGAAVAAGKSANGAPQLDNPTTGVAPLSMDSNKAAAGSKELNAPAGAPATVASKALPNEPKAADSRDVSPMSKQPLKKTAGQEQPTVTDGVNSSKTAKESTPAAAVAGAPVGTPRKAADAVKENSTPAKRGSMIDKLKGKDTPEAKKESANSTPATKEKKKGLFTRIKEKLNK